MKSWTATEEEIVQGKTTDVYFLRTKECLVKENLEETKVWTEITTGGIPRDGKRLLFLGLQETLDLFSKADLAANIYSMKEGTIVPDKDVNGVRIPFMAIEGKYSDFAIYETPILGMLCFQSGVGTSALRLRLAAEDCTLLSFGIRRMPPVIAPIIDRACYVAGFDGISCVLSAEKLGLSPTGTIPHAFIMIMGGIAEAAKSFDSTIDTSVLRIILSDTFNDERIEVLQALEAIGERLYGVRLDTPGSRRGDFRAIINEIKWELKLRKREDVKIFLSGGLTEDSINEYKDIADGFGIGTFVSNSPTIDFALDIVEIEGSEIAKRGKFASKKQVGYCRECHIYECFEFNKKTKECSKCGQTMENLLDKVMDNGKIVITQPTEQGIKEYVAKQLQTNSEI